MSAPSVALAKSAPDEGPRHLLAFTTTVFLSAFLLFQMQLIVGKQLLPWFGGTAAVWNTCLVFFQLLLLFGYAYSHWLTASFSAPAVARMQLGLLLVSAAVLLSLAAAWQSPIYPNDSWRPQHPGHPTWDLMVLLLVSVGLPFFLLSTTAPLVQTWFARVNPGSSPYQLYALSNLGSLLGLLTYPTLFEPNLTLRNQGRVWTLAYFAFACSGAVCACRSARGRGEATNHAKAEISARTPDQKPLRGQRLLWLGLAACGSVMLLSATNLICQEIAVVPFLWVLPLGIYLLSFVLSFHGSFYRRGVFHVLFAATTVWVGILFLSGENVRAGTQIFGFSLLLFVSCMVYHGELARLKPQAQDLTSFYLYMAGGGALGSAFVGLIAPSIFPAIWEFQLGLWFSGLLLAVVLLRDKDSWLYNHLRWLPLAVLVAIAAVADAIGVAVTIFHVPPVYFHALVVTLALSALVTVATGPRRRARRPGWLHGSVLCGWCCFGLLFWVQAHRQRSHSVALSRNFYGVLRIAYSEPIAEHYALLERHGLTLHGAQLQNPTLRRTPTAYYGPSSGVGLLLSNYRAVDPQERHLRMGVIGLGVGTLAAYGQPGDYIRFYEMNPEVVRFAQGRQALFSFLNDSPARTEVVMGDARISLERELASGLSQRFDVLVIDAFSSDSIPLHLLTREAMGTYLRHLRDQQSVLAFHISNRTLNFLPVLAGLARQHQLQLERVLASKVQGEAELPSHWVLMAADPTVLNMPALLKRTTPIQLEGSPRLWTDDYSNLLELLR